MLSVLRFFTLLIFKASGFSWFVHKDPENKVGYWKKTFHNKKRDFTHSASTIRRIGLIPGLGDSPLSWYWVVFFLNSTLKMHFDEIILFDFPGFSGFLGNEKVFSSKDSMSKFMFHLLDSMCLHTLIGYSLGGWLTASYAASCGAKGPLFLGNASYQGPRSIILISPSGIFRDDQMRFTFEDRFFSLKKFGFSKLRSYLFEKEPIWFHLVAVHCKKMFRRLDMIAFIYSFRDHYSIDKVTQNIQAHVWLIWGEKDSLIPASCASEWLKNMRLDNRKFERIRLLKGVGHNPQIEAPLKTVSVIKEVFMEDNYF